MRNDATEAQVQAADPAQSTWLAANAGSGKTRVLTDRVARLLLAGTEPQKILCLTYTKAAASEMQNRLFQRLGKWAMLEESTLRQELRDLGVDGAIDAPTLARARRLFARATETPGGLKIQTIHSFCAALLRRFPLEARVSADFTELDDRSAVLLRREIIETLAAGADVPAVDALAGLQSSEDLTALLGEICRFRDGFREDLTRDAATALFGLPDGFVAQHACKIAFDGSEAGLFADVVPILAQQSKTMVDLAEVLRATDVETPHVAALEALFAGLLYKDRAVAKVDSVPTKKAREALGGLADDFSAFMQRVAAAKQSLLALAALEKTLALHRFARAFLPRYAARKAARGLLDFDDLIARAAELLADRSVAAWVLYRLDGGIDHILVDEAQDTSPGQWRVIESLVEEFTSGQGARDRERRIFVVGDKKQSIYSFQGANLETFDTMHDHFAQRHSGAGAAFQRLNLLHSFRSSTAILQIVDLTFDERVNQGLGGETKHIAFKADLPGRVDLWQPIAPAGKPEPKEWDNPVDLLPDTHETVLLAEKIAHEIRRMIGAGVQIPTKDGPRQVHRPVHEGDFLVLVRRRSALFQEIIRACKAAGLRIAGADRLRLGAELAVKDLTALLAFLATPEDDLSLAAALRSPLFGWSEAGLFDLAHRRAAKVYLWQALRAETCTHGATLAVLDDLRRQADFLRPFELIERILIRHDGRRKLLARLGPEAEDGIDAFLAEALSYEGSDVPSLTGFLVWMQTGEIEVKRRLDSASKAIRVMTVHGAKGLESPIVILPDTAIRKDNRGGAVLRPDRGAVLWRTRAEDSPAVIAAEVAQRVEKDREERMRLLYVAMTRAENWLIVCAAGEVGQGADSWFSLIDAAMDKAGAARFPAPDQFWDFGAGKRHVWGTWPDAAAEPANTTEGEARALPVWATTAAAEIPEVETPLSPSDLGGAKALPGDAGAGEELAKERGTALHVLLEQLPPLPENTWRAAAAGLLDRLELSGPVEAAAIFDEARAVLLAPALAHLFRSEVLAEVGVSARLPELGGRMMQGAIDRLIIGPDRVLAVDFKSNAVVPARPEDVPQGILRQMGAYAAMLAQIWPEKSIDTAIVWTRNAQLMPLPRNIVSLALHESGASVGHTPLTRPRREPTFPGDTEFTHPLE